MLIAKKQNKVIALFLVVALFFTLIPTTKVHAQTISVDGSLIEVQQLNSNTFQFIEGDFTETIQLTKNNLTTSEITITNNNTNETITLTYNKNNNTLYSSKTGKTVDFSNVVSSDDQISTLAAGDVMTKKISYKQIKDSLGTAGTIAGVAGIVIVILTAGGLNVATTVTVLTTILGGVSGLISDCMKGSSSHGLKITLKSSIRKTTKNGKVYSYEVWSITSVAKY